jgi:hypothetical protein
VITFFGMEKVKFIRQKKGAVMSAVGHERPKALARSHVRSSSLS